jgi:predicted dehydrogenase
MSQPNIRIGLLGLGQMGRNHLRVLSLLRGVEIAFVFDADADHAAAIAAQHDLTATTDLDASLDTIDALVICTPTVTHADYVRRFAPRVKALFVEKPLAHSLAAAQAIESAVRDHGTLVQVGFIERFNPAIVALSGVLTNAQRVINIDFTRTNRLSSRITDVDVVMDLMIHDIDLALYLNGPVRDVVAHGVVHDGLIEFASAQLTHENGRFSRVQASRITERKIRLIQATCEDRFVDCDLLRKEIVVHRQSVLQQKGADAYSITSQQEIVAVGQQEALLSELQAFAAMAREGQGSVPDFASGIASLAVAEAVTASVLREKP